MKQDQVELIDGTIYFTLDGWETVWKSDRGANPRPVTDKEEADRARFLAVSQSSAGP